MIKYDFDKIIDRSQSDAYKWRGLQDNFGRDDLMPLWIADMDFATPDFIIDAMRKRLDHPVFGYPKDPDEYWPTVMEWIWNHHQWKVEREWLTYIPGIVKGIGMAINVFTHPNDKIIIQPPVYHPFHLVPLGNHRQVVENPLKETADGRYEMDFDNLEAVADGQCRMLILCNPHNPIGITWDRDTLIRLADFCCSRNIVVVSDEIHADMALFGNKHIPFATVSKQAEMCSITFQAPSKTFNIAGIVSSYAVVPNSKMREAFFSWLSANELNEAPLFSPICTVAAYKNGEEWRKQMLEYVEQNILFAEDYVKKYIPKVKVVRPQASFLIWLDFREMGLDHEALLSLIMDKAHLALNDGEMFGKEGAGHMRMNVATPRATLENALDKLRMAVEELNK